MTAYYNSPGSDYEQYEHQPKKRSLRASVDYDRNVRFVLEDIAMLLERIAIALEEKDDD